MEKRCTSAVPCALTPKIIELNPELFTGHDAAHGWGQEGIKSSRVASGRIRRCSKSHGSGRVGSGRVRPDSNHTGRAGFKSYVSGRVQTLRIGPA